MVGSEVIVVGDAADGGVAEGGRIEGRTPSGGVSISREVRANRVGDVEGPTVRVRRDVELSRRSIIPIVPSEESKLDLRILESEATTTSTVAFESLDVLI